MFPLDFAVGQGDFYQLGEFALFTVLAVWHVAVNIHDSGIGQAGSEEVLLLTLNRGTNKIRDMVSVQVPGVPLTPRTAAPRQLPYHDGFVYFELDKGAAAWQDVVKAGALALHISGTFPDLGIQLWAIRS